MSKEREREKCRSSWAQHLHRITDLRVGERNSGERPLGVFSKGQRKKEREIERVREEEIDREIEKERKRERETKRKMREKERERKKE